MAQPTYYDELLAFITAMTYGRIQFPWSDPTKREDYDPTLQLRTYLNLVSTSNPCSKRPGVLDPKQKRPDTGGRQPKTVGFAEQLEVLHPVDVDLCDFSETRGRKAGRRRQRRRRTSTPTKTKIYKYQCKCKGLPCSNHHLAVVLPERPSPVQDLVAIKALEKAVRSLIRPPDDWLQPAQWGGSPTKRDETCRLVMLGYHLWLAIEDVKTFTRACHTHYQTKLPALHAALTNLLSCHKLLRTLETQSRGIIRKLTANPLHPLQALVVGGTGCSLDHILKLTAGWRDAVEGYREGTASSAESVYDEARNLMAMALIAMEDLMALKTLSSKAEYDLALCSAGLDQMRGFLESVLTSLAGIFIPVSEDVTLLRHSREIRVGQQALPRDLTEARRGVVYTETLVRRFKRSMKRCGDWGTTLGDLLSAYRMVGLEQVASAPAGGN
ncbi:hypothetical protein VTK56DRAFT_1501 [Thermocarpiscus australiensis]